MGNVIADSIAALRLIGGTVDLLPGDQVRVDGDWSPERDRVEALLERHKQKVLMHLNQRCTRCNQTPVPAGRLYGDHDLPTANYCYPCLQAVAAARYPHTPGKANPNETKVRHTLTPVMERQLDLR